jgi:ketopantoate reductase
MASMMAPVLRGSRSSQTPTARRSEGQQASSSPRSPQALREHGLRVQSVKGDFTVQVAATDDLAGVGPCDYVLFCVKAFDTGPAAVRLGPLLADGTAVLSLQNGVDNEESSPRRLGRST